MGMQHFLHLLAVALKILDCFIFIKNPKNTMSIFLSNKRAWNGMSRRRTHAPLNDHVAGFIMCYL